MNCPLNTVAAGARPLAHAVTLAGASAQPRGNHPRPLRGLTRRCLALGLQRLAGHRLSLSLSSGWGLAVFTAALQVAPALAADRPAAAAPQRPPASQPVALGRYLVQTTGCNDCHTAGYAANAGQVPEKDWLTGDGLGWRGPWGTTYATNLRLQFSQLSEAQWLAHARGMQPRPPMPWFALRDMSDADLRAIYRYMRAAGPAGQPAPAALPPGATPRGPFVQFPQ